MRDCAREIDGQYCGRPHTTTRLITAFITLEDSPSNPALEYRIDLCAEHAAEYDNELPTPLPRYIREWGR